MNQLTKEVLNKLSELKKREQSELHCTNDDFEVLFIATLIEEEEANGGK